MVVGVVFGTGQAGGITGRDDGRLEAAGDVHNGWENILYVGNPQVEGTRPENEFGADGIGQGDDPFIAVHGGQTGTADAVELDALGTVRLGQVDEFLGAADADDFTDQGRKMAVNGDVDIAFFQSADIYF